MKECTEHHSQYIYHSSAYAIAGEIYRPVRKSLPVQGARVLPVTGGHSSQCLDGFSLDCLVSYKSACVEVGGSYDKCHAVHTSYFSSTIEGLNIAGILTADRVVARMMVYSPEKNHAKDDRKKQGEPTFDITGSYFENLKIAGHPINVSLDTGVFHGLNTYSAFNNAYKDRSVDPLLLVNKLSKLSSTELNKLTDQYHSLRGLPEIIDTWKADKIREPKDLYLCSAFNQLEIAKHVPSNSELKGYGAIICIPKFGVIRLGEVLVTKQFRSLTMFTVQMGSVNAGVVTGGSGSTGGGNGLP
jgi:hypothetical protein